MLQFNKSSESDNDISESEWNKKSDEKESNDQKISSPSENQEKEEKEINQIFCGIDINYDQNFQRKLIIQLINLNKRSITLYQIEDTSQFSNLDSFIFQNNPQDVYSSFNLVIKFPKLRSEKEKIVEIIKEANINYIKIECPLVYREEGNSIDKQILQVPLSEQYDIKKSITQEHIYSLANTMRQIDSHIENQRKFQILQGNLECFMGLDVNAQSSLSLFTFNQQYQFNNSIDYNFKNQKCQSIYEFLNKCQTIIGKRKLKQWMLQPLQDIKAINRRLDIVEKLIKHNYVQNYLNSSFLRYIPDLDKLFLKFYKINSDIPNHGGTLEDVVKVYQLVKNIKNLISFFQMNELDFEFNEVVQNLSGILEDCDQLIQLIEGTINLECARINKRYKLSVKYSKAIKRLTITLQKIVIRQEQIKNSIQQNHGIKVRIQEIEKGNNQSDIVMVTTQAEFQKAKKNYEEFKIGDEPLLFLHKISTREVQFTTHYFEEIIQEYNSYALIYSEEYDKVTEEVLKIVSTYYPVLESASEYISELDILNSFSQVAIQENQFTTMCRPIIQNDKYTNIKDIFHPCLERESLVLNDFQVKGKNGQSFLNIIQGPNMGGKSTFIRTVAINIYLAHIGCFVCASEAIIPLTSNILTRVGAQDFQYKKISTFMNEVIEIKLMLQQMKANSLSIVDELGRGTSTGDGLGIAWAISEHIAQNNLGNCLFATHFNELAQLNQTYDNVKILNISEPGQFSKFKIQEGESKGSFGIDIIKTLKFPEEIINNSIDKISYYSKLYNHQTNKDIYIMKGSKEQLDNINQNKNQEKQNDDDNNIQYKIQVVNAVEKILKQYNNNNAREYKEQEVLQDIINSLQQMNINL